jgi:hypothetical protein
MSPVRTHDSPVEETGFELLVPLEPRALAKDCDRYLISRGRLTLGIGAGYLATEYR